MQNEYSKEQAQALDSHTMRDQIIQSDSQIEVHPLAPFVPQHARVLMLGSFPPPRARWKMEFYYPNLQNDMWRIFGLVFFQDANHFLDLNNKAFRQAQIEEFLTAKGIAIFDTAYKIRRLKNNAADQFLEVVEATDMQQLLGRMPACRFILTTGDKATDTLLQSMPEGTAKAKIGQFSSCVYAGRELELHRLPSSSRAYPLALAKKAQAYQDFFQHCGLLSA